MAYADIPTAVRDRLASDRVRMYHALWHFVRNRAAWTGLSPDERQPLIDQGWTPPRFEREPLAGIDFLQMHRQMITMVNAWAAEEPAGGHHGHGGALGGAHEHGAGAPFVVGWLDVPWNHEDPVWPMPLVDLTDPRNAQIFRDSKAPETTARYQQRCIDRFANRDWLRTVTIDAFATELEFSIHGWFHMHWSAPPPADPNSLDPANDWLGSPFSSHVNRHFWKLHGWIDDRIKAWEDANGQAADLSLGWDGPLDSVTGEMHSASPELFETLGFREREVLVMPWTDILLED